MVVTTLEVSVMHRQLFGFSAGRSTVVMMLALKARCEADRDCAHHHRVGTQQHQRSPEAGNLLCPIATNQRPPRTHDYVALQ